MRFSIVTVTLNSQHHLAETMESVRAQRFSDFEHLIWDGGSKDNTLEIIARYPEVRLVTGKDIGISDAMNKGAAHARGDYLLFLHSDDALAHPGVLEEVDRFLKENPERRWVYGGVELIDEAGGLIEHAGAEPFLPARLRKYNTISHPATLLSRQLFEKVGGFRTDLRYCMDYELWLRLAKEQVVGHPMPFTVSKFRKHTGSLSTSQPLAVAQEAYRVRNRYVTSLWERLISYRIWKRRVRKIRASTKWC